MSVYCKLGETDVPPVGCREFDPNWCKLDMKCPFLEEDADETCEQLLDGRIKKAWSEWCTIPH